jgi:hypothetical protein
VTNTIVATSRVISITCQRPSQTHRDYKMSQLTVTCIEFTRLVGDPCDRDTSAALTHLVKVNSKESDHVYIAISRSWQEKAVTCMNDNTACRPDLRASDCKRCANANMQRKRNAKRRQALVSDDQPKTCRGVSADAFTQKIICKEYGSTSSSCADASPPKRQMLQGAQQMFSNVWNTKMGFSTAQHGQNEACQCI